MIAFIISLPDSRERRRSAIAKIRPTGIPFEIVDGVETRKYRHDALVCDRTKWWPPMKPGEIGCFYSHMRVLTRIVDYDLPWAFVFEDDFCYEPDPERGLCEIANQLPAKFDHLGLQSNIGLNPKRRVIAEHGRFLQMRETSLQAIGYVITQSFARVVLDHHSRCQTPIDQMYSRLSYTHIMYELRSPIIGIQSDFESVTH